ncbi:DUF3500 domain-containing protein [Myxosarcina sp. GI1]|uniref:DUF3500 domain-containing protein n=1 Tax=Myxosarcina sp. GI1 TaxID=1541065 RepID=UPI00056073D9|nr:DUF3500 domain-containing protein [Myxosarcina sp. GI1]
MKFFLFSQLTTFICLITSVLVVERVSDAQSIEGLNPLSERRFFSQVKTHGNSQNDLIAFDSELSGSIESVRYQEVVTAIQNFLALLDDRQRASVVLPFEHPYRTRGFCYVLARCAEDNVGLRLSQLNAKQKIALNNVLMKSYSSAGYSRAIQTMNREGLLQEMEDAYRADPKKHPVIGSPLVSDWTPPPYRRSSDYYVAIFGEPVAATEPLSANPWGIRFEGHHLSLNLTFNGSGVRPQINAMPMFFGSSPTIVPQSPTPEAGEYSQWHNEEGQQLLHREAWLARSFLQSLDQRAIARGAWSVLPDVDLLGGTAVPLDAASYLDGEKPGIPVAELTPLQQRLLWDFVDEFWQIQANSEKIDEYALKQSIADSRVWWYGDRHDEHGELYFRIQSDRYLIELLQSNTFGLVSDDVEANHIHSSFRDLKNDWDRNFLGDHLRQHHVR